MKTHNEPYTITLIAQAKEQIKKIQTSPNYLKITKCADNLTYENLLLILLNNPPKKVEEDQTSEFEEVEEEIAYQEFKNDVLTMMNKSKKTSGYTQPKMPYDNEMDDYEPEPEPDEMTGININIDIDETITINKKQKHDTHEFCTCDKFIPSSDPKKWGPSSWKILHEQAQNDCYDSPIFIPNPAFCPDQETVCLGGTTWTPENPFPGFTNNHQPSYHDYISENPSPKPFSNNYQSSPYYDFKNTIGISTTQTIIKKNLNTEYIKLLDPYWEKKIHTIKGMNYDAITNIKLALLGIAGLQDKTIELVLKVNNNLLCSQTILITNTSNNSNKCEFISFPNIIINHPKYEQRIDIYMRGEFSNISNQQMGFNINYDTILFEAESRGKIFMMTNTYIFEMTTGVICMYSGGMFGTRYMTQLLDTAHTDFKKLYIVADNDKEEEKEDQEDKEIITENIKITI